jgi:D-3-phosphoglycerate dehydrogenase
MNILARDPYAREEDVKISGAILVSLEILLRESDFVAIHARETPETVHLIGKDELCLMKPKAYLINTSRGSLIDEKALYQALMEKTIAGAALDVYEEEPLKADNPLIKLDNVTLTPHLAGGSDRARERSIAQTTLIVSRYLQGEGLAPMDIVDPGKVSIA